MTSIEEMLFATAFAAVAGVFVLRFPAGLRRPEARKTWLAAGVGAVGLLCLGAVFPLGNVDAVLGGSNVYYLVMCMASTIAFTLMSGSVLDKDRQKPHGWIPAALMIVAFTIPFLLTDRGATSPKFTHEQVGQLSMLLCTGIYLFGLSLICGNLIWRLRRSPLRAYWPIMVGALLVIGSAITETTSMAADHFGWVGRDVVEGGYLYFTPLFFPGVIFMAAGIASFAVRKRLRDRKTRLSSKALDGALSAHQVATPWTPEGEESDDQLMRLWLLVVRLKDAESAGAAVLSVRQARDLRTAETLLEKQLTVPMWSAA